MMMFASDLDRTLIYSERALAEFNQADRNDLIGVERKNKLEAAFMTKAAYNSLKEIAGQILFIPVTTRTTEQFQRIFIFPDDIRIKYAVTSNGANMLYKGSPLKEWNEIVQRRLQNECASMEDMISKMREYEITGQLKIAQNLFFYYILTDEITSETKKRIGEYANSKGWRVSLQGRKLYLMPLPVCKGEAVKYITRREGVTKVFGAGDSLLDYDFLKVCDYPFVPNHGEIINENMKSFNYKISQNRGVKAGEEILSGISHILKERIQPG